ncbi:MAG: hypothetical protein R2764_25815 [Bacteroidales bacterium]
MTDTIINEIKFSNSGVYQIRVLGKVCPEIWDYFQGEIVRISECKSGQIYTLLKVYVRDQAELSGLINILYNWHLVLLSVKIEGMAEEMETK